MRLLVKRIKVVWTANCGGMGMHTFIRTSVQVIGELLAVCTTREDLLEEMQSLQIKTLDKPIRELLDELSPHGDAANATFVRSGPEHLTTILQEVAEFHCDECSANVLIVRTRFGGTILTYMLQYI